MRSSKIVALATGAVVSLTGTVLADVLLPGDPLPRTGMLLENATGAATQLEHLRGDGGTLVVFTAIACTVARDRESRTVALAREFASLGVITVWINSSDPTRGAAENLDEMRRHAAEAGFGRYLADDTGAVARAFQAARAPEAFLFDGHGYLVYRGAIDDAPDADEVTRSHLREALAAMFRGEAIDIARTEVDGCPIR